MISSTFKIVGGEKCVDVKQKIALKNVMERVRIVGST